MRIVKQSVEILTPLDAEQILKFITKVGYVSHGTNKEPDFETAKRFVKKHCIESKPEHGTLLEFGDIVVKLVTDRGISHEIVRHRIASYNQMSTRYVWENELEVIAPLGMKEKNPEAYKVWWNSCKSSENSYQRMKSLGCSAEDCRGVLPTDTATVIVMKLNFRSWRNFFRLRNHKLAHPKMRELAGMVLKEFQKMLPVVFDDYEAWEDEITL